MSKAGRLLDWEAAMGFGLGVLKLSPNDFWAATPRELLAAARGLGLERSAPLSRGAFDELQLRFPDG